jgi:hypothetical protein
MSSTEGINFGVQNMSPGFDKLPEREKKLRMSVNLHPVYLENVLKIINNRIEDEDVKNAVVKEAKRCPHSALSQFLQRLESITQEQIKKLNFAKRKENEKIPASHKKQKENKLQTEELLDIQEDLFEQLTKDESHNDKDDSGLVEDKKESQNPTTEISGNQNST